MSSGDKTQGMATEGLPKGPDIKEHTQEGQPGLQAEMETQPEITRLPTQHGHQEVLSLEEYVEVGKLKGRRVIITGGDSGIGLSAAVKGSHCSTWAAAPEKLFCCGGLMYLCRFGRRCKCLPGGQTRRARCSCRRLGATARCEQSLHSLSKNADCYSAQPCQPRTAEPRAVDGEGRPSGQAGAGAAAAAVAGTQSLGRIHPRSFLRHSPSRIADYQPGFLSLPSPIPALQPSECGPSYVFLASQESTYFTGQVLHPNGGMFVTS